MAAPIPTAMVQCDHINAKAWVLHAVPTGGTKAYCPGCRKFMGYVHNDGKRPSKPPAFDELRPKDEAASV